jgi:hypothetical protein
MLVAWSFETHQACHVVEVVVPVGDLGLDACWPLFVSLFEAFELTSLGLAPKLAGVAGWQHYSHS